MSERSRIWLDDSTIHYWSSIDPEWSLPVEQVKVIGEFTNDNGPFVDDWFLIFVTGLDPLWQQASCYADGNRRFLKDLSATLGSELQPALYASANFASRIIWPAELSGKPLFGFVDEKPKGNSIQTSPTGWREDYLLLFGG